MEVILGVAWGKINHRGSKASCVFPMGLKNSHVCRLLFMQPRAVHVRVEDASN